MIGFLILKYQTIVVGMQRMFRYDKQIADDYRVDTVLSKTTFDIKASSSSSSLSFRQDYDDDDSDEGKDIQDTGDDVKLPPFVKEILDLIHFSTNPEGNQSILSYLFPWAHASL